MQARKLSRAFSTFKWDASEGSNHHQHIPLHHARGGNERYSDRDGRPIRDEEGRLQSVSAIAHNLNLISLGGRSRADSMRDSHREGPGYTTLSRTGSFKEIGSGNGGHALVDVEKGHVNGEWVENGENIDVRRRSGAV